MKNMQAAAEDIKKLGAFMTNLLEFAKDLESVGSIQQAADEAKARIDQMAAKEIEVKEALSLAEGKLAKANSDASGVMQKAQEDAIKMINIARAKADGLIATAKVDADKVVRGSQERKIQLELQVQDLLEKRAVHLEEAQDAESKLIALKSELDALKAKLGV